MSSGSGLPPAQHTAFAVASRLISCLVTEQILHAFYVPIPCLLPEAAGLLVVLSIGHSDSSHGKTIITSAPLTSKDVFALVPLRNSPVFIDGNWADAYGRPVGLVDPLDMYPGVFQVCEASLAPAAQVSKGDLADQILSYLTPPLWELGDSIVVAQVADPVRLWKTYADSAQVQSDVCLAVEKEIQSSFDHQLLAYLNPPTCPSLTSPPIEWEQSLVAGHPTHPMHRARVLPEDIMQYDWYHPRIRFVCVSRSRVNIRGPFEDQIDILVGTVAEKAGKQLPDDPSLVFMPVHELQIPNIRRLFPDVEVLHPDISLQGLAQASLRTIISPAFPGMALKLAIGVTISSGLRTISHWTADFGPRFSTEVIPKLSINPDILLVMPEMASCNIKASDPEVAQNFTAVLREEFQPQEGEALIVCAALLEMDHAGAPVGISAVEHVFGLDTSEKRAAFLDRYLQLACQALLPPLIENGVGFEAHAQNLLARFDIATKRLLGFVVRDWGGIHVHPPTLQRSTGISFDFLPGHTVVSDTLEGTYPGFYHALVHNHVQRLIRILGLHRDGTGWEMLRRHLDGVIPAGHALRKIWLSPPDSRMVLSKCLFKMRTQGLYRDMVYKPIPNMIQYRGEPELESSRL